MDDDVDPFYEMGKEEVETREVVACAARKTVPNGPLATCPSKYCPTRYVRHLTGAWANYADYLH